MWLLPPLNVSTVRPWPVVLLLALMLPLALPAATPPDSANTPTGYYPEKTNFLRFGTGLAFPVVQDDKLSSLRYRGIGGYGDMGYDTYAPRFQNRFNLAFVAGLLNRKQDLNNAVGISSQLFQVHIWDDYLRQVARLQVFKQPLWVHAGARLGLWASLRIASGLRNSSATFDGIGNFGPVANARWRFPFKRDLFLEYRASLPVLAYVLRPRYNNYLPFLDPDMEPIEEFAGESRFAGWGSFFRFSQRVALVYPLRNANEFSISYGWNYYSFQGEHHLVQAANHSLRLSVLFQL
mgnify:CR=1 FL=1